VEKVFQVLDPDTLPIIHLSSEILGIPKIIREHITRPIQKPTPPKKPKITHKTIKKRIRSSIPAVKPHIRKEESKPTDHSITPIELDLVTAVKDVKRVKTEDERWDRVQRTKANEKLILVSRRGKRVKELHRCDECGVTEKVLWRYSKSNGGVVYICDRCKGKVFDRSFDELDAMNLAWTSDFESNPRRH
jgi:hypothetical protein